MQQTEKTVSEAIQYRRSVRVYDEGKKLDSNKVKTCLEQASLAPNSSNMQLWEFYHITSTEVLDKLSPLCFNQNAAKTAQEMVVFVVRKDLYKKRIKSNLNHLNRLFPPKPKAKQTSREKFAKGYYQKVMPFLYSEFLGIWGYLKFIGAFFTGLFKPMYRQVRKSDMRVVVHKSCGLAAQNFMLSMAAIDYDTCPMEGFDSIKVKKLLKLPNSAEVNMIISCGIRKPEGVYGERFRIPFEEVYTEV